MITLSTSHKTRCGYSVVIHEIKPLNSVGNEVTFPLKGTYYKPTKSGKLKPVYTIWKADGKHEVFGDSDLDIV